MAAVTCRCRKHAKMILYKTTQNIPKNTPKNDLKYQTSDGKPLADATTTQNTFLGDANNSNISESSSFGAKTPKTTPPDIENNLKLILEPDSIIRVGMRIESAAPHIHERANKADGLSIPDVLKLTYKHKDYPNEVFIKYWILNMTSKRDGYI